jgi:hypothetical protein
MMEEGRLTAPLPQLELHTGQTVSLRQAAKQTEKPEPGLIE